MPSLLNSVNPRHLAVLVRHLEQEGFSCADALAQANLSYEMLDLRWVPIASVLTAMQELVRTSGRTDLGFVRGQLTNIGINDVASQLLLSAPTLRQGLQAISPFMPLISAVIRMRCRDDNGNLVVDWSLTRPLPYIMGMVALETVVVSVHRQLLFLLQEQEVQYAIRFSWTPPLHAARYRELKSPTVSFGHGGPLNVSITILQALADRPLATADARVLREADRHAHETLRELARQQSFAEWVTQVLATVESEPLGLEDVARLLGVSGKTLSRYLAQENTRFGVIAQRVRQQRATWLLDNTTTGIGDIAHQLGFATTANFVRAFKTANGLTPLRYRNRPVETAGPSSHLHTNP